MHWKTYFVFAILTFSLEYILVEGNLTNATLVTAAIVVTAIMLFEATEYRIRHEIYELDTRIFRVEQKLGLEFYAKDDMTKYEKKNR